MPSGAKKRKAAKKKREQEANNNNNSSISTDNHQGNDDPKSHDETETDGGEVGTSVSQDQHNHQHPFNEGNEEYEKGGPSPSDSLANKNKPMEVVTGDAEGSLQVESEDSIAVNIESKSVSIEHVDSSKESHDEDDRSSSSSSFSNESQDFEKKSKEANDEEKEIGSFSEEVKQISENEKLVKEADSNSVLETASADLVDPVVPISETEKFVIEIAQVENPEVLEVVESCFEEDEDKLLPVSNETAEVSPATVVPKKNEDKVFPISDENVGASANVVGSSAYGNVGKTLVSSASHSAETGNGEEKTKYTDARQITENKPPLACGPRVAERTSWMSCCGIFDVLTGSK
ncbi:PREDICTED: transcription factor mef2A isoform X2 [Populus euphratica]|uniref:Transcription factor mef2A isoform X2 n=1 Tax=Populus euphratica TaxID=75702 RepID=A0AAJ6T7T6_POPEU|nr:PREDICTED: transcription factor mef2A isoform X2 [Populus euphratica]